MEENGTEIVKSGKDLERSWNLDLKQDLLEMLPGSPILLKE
jgi:hypothetical protein